MKGLRSRDKRIAFKDLVSNYKAGVFLLQETKLSRMDRSGLMELRPFDCPNGVCFPSKGEGL